MLDRRFAICALLAITACGPTLPEEGDAVAGDGLRDELDLSDDDNGLVPTLRVCADGATTLGIDVSKWQGTINWPQVKAAGFHYAFVRVSDGASVPDARFTANWTGAKAAGVIRGAYQFFRPGQNVTTQADMMINAIGRQLPGDLPPVIDVEDAAGLAPATVAARARQWVDRVRGALGVTPIVYTGKFFWRDEVGGPASFAPNPLWIAQYTSLCPDLPAPWTRWTFWQFTDSGTVAGISGPVDTNRFNGTLAQLQAFAGAGGGGTVTPRPLPFSWTRNADGSYSFAVAPGTGVDRVELRVEDFLIGTATTPAGSGSLRYTFNVSRASRAIEARGLTAAGVVGALGNGIIDSIAGTALFIRQTGDHEYEIGLERAPSTYATVEVDVEGFLLTDIDTGAQRSTRRAVRWRFNGLGNRAVKLVARNASGTIVDTRTRTLLVR